MNDINSTTQRRTAATSSSAPSSGASLPRSPASGNNNSSQTTTSTVMLPLRIISKLPTIATILLRVLLWPLFKLMNMIFPIKEYDGINNTTGNDRAARSFVAMFQKNISSVRPAQLTDNNNQEVVEQYVEPACPFSPRGYNSTLGDITSRPTNTRPLLLLYLHSPLNPNGTKFIQKYLCHSQLLQLLNANNMESSANNTGSVLCFGASVHTADGEKIRNMMGVCEFPFVALLNVKGNNNNNNNNGPAMELLLRMEGPQLLTLPPSQITTYLNTTISRHAELLAVEEARRLQREEDALLREEQNREFQETLLADQMREIERQEAQDRERREQEEKEEAERLKVAQEESRLEDAKSIIEKAGEPDAGMKQGVARLRFTLPNGKKIDRRFHTTDTIETLRAFLFVHFHESGIDIKNVGLSTNFPRG